MSHTFPALSVMTAVFGLLIGSGPAWGQSHVAAQWGPTISVNGSGEVQHEPDMAEINVGVVTEAESAAMAVQSNNQKMAQLLQALRQHGLDEKDIQTSNFQISPQRQHEPERRQPPRITGYQVTNQVHITVRDLPKLGEILDAAVQQGANEIHGINFSISDPSELAQQALQKAVASARRKAEALAEEADVTLGRVLHIHESSHEPPRPMMGRAMMMAEADRVPISPGSMTVRADVSVTYEIGDGEDRE